MHDEIEKRLFESLYTESSKTLSHTLSRHAWEESIDEDMTTLVSSRFQLLTPLTANNCWRVDVITPGLGESG